MNERFLREAIRLSLDKMQDGEGGPFGAVVARGNEIVGTGWNKVTTDFDPTAHAEIVAVRDACSRLGTFTLEGCAMYASCEPCPMCLGAILWARLDRVYYAAGRDDAARAGFDDARFYEEIARQSASRSLVMIQGLRREALEAFDVWMAKDDRVTY